MAPECLGPSQRVPYFIGYDLAALWAGSGLKDIARDYADSKLEFQQLGRETGARSSPRNFSRPKKQPPG
jgi:hypothetical protein